MRRHLSLATILLSLLLSACTTESLNPGVDYNKAAEVNAKMGAGYMNQGNYELAMVKLTKALKFDGDNMHANHYMGELHRRLGEMDKADEYFQQALDLDETDAQLLNNYGVFLCGVNRYKEAEGYFSKVLKNPLYRGKARVYENLGLCAKMKGNLATAERHFRKALKVNPKLATSLLALAQLKFDQRNQVSAYSYFQQFTKISRHTAESLWLGVLLEKARGNRSQMGNYSLRLKGKFPHSKETELLGRMEARGKRK